MGEWREYKCGKCGYAAEVSGRRDRGMLVGTNTKMCPNCLRIVDVLVKIFCPPEIAATLKVDIKDKGRCPECGNFKTLPWKGRLCPKCGGKMKPGGPVCMWD